MRKKDFSRISKRNVHKRNKKDRAKSELLSVLKECGFDAENVKIKASLDLGRGGRISDKKRADETIAEGVFSSSKSGFGFVKVEGAERDIFIPENKTGGAIDGDFVEIIYHSFKSRYGEEKTEGRVKRIIEYGRKTLIGELCTERVRHGRRSYYRFFLLPDDTRVSLRPDIIEDGSAREGDKVEAEIVRNGTSSPDCRIIKVFGSAESKEANYAAILSEEGIEIDFTPEALEIADRASAETVVTDGRTDLREEIILTMDGAGAKDLDDAVSLCRLADGGYRLGVHIADVSHYVKEKTALDRAAMSRGTSVYFTDKVVPMLPAVLSNGACSLNGGEDKYALSAIIDLDEKGMIRETVIKETVIRSKVRGVYSEINLLLSGEESAELVEKYRDVLPTIRMMHSLYLILKEKNASRGSIDFDAPEAEIILDESGLPVRIEKRERGDSERMIEQFMLTANEAVATALHEKGIPCVYRIHEAPPKDKLSDFVNYVHNLGFDTSVITKNENDSLAYARLLSVADERGMLLPVSYAMLRTMSKAVYSEVKKPHFGLGIENYCHFTSPIRRLSDLATHRIIKKTLLGEKTPKQYESYAKRAAAAATEAELRAVSAERRIENLYKVLFMEEHIGEEFDAIVCSVTSFGLFVELSNTCEGLVPLSLMPGAFIYEERSLTLRSADKIYRVADPVRVRLIEADRVRGKLGFEIVR